MAYCPHCKYHRGPYEIWDNPEYKRYARHSFVILTRGQKKPGHWRRSNGRP